MSALPDHEPGCRERAGPCVELVIEARPRDLGGLVVARLLPSGKRRLVGPFIYLDRMGPLTLSPTTGFDVLPHPHIGLSTLTYFLEGRNVHRDSLGNVRVVGPGDVALMTAGRGIVHSERADPAFRQAGGVMHGIQIWLALPEANEDDAPSFAFHPAASLPPCAPAAGIRGRVLAGTAFGVTSPLAHPSQPLLVDLELEPGAALELPEATERGVFVIEGEVRIADEVLARDRLAVLAPGTARVTATAASRVLVIGGPAMGRRLIDWNFVASTQDRIDRARAAWQAQAFPKIPTDQDEHVPYPERRR